MTATRAAYTGAIFLDRDGTLNRKAPEGQYIRRPQDLDLLPGAAEAVLHINRAGIRAILVTNQRWLSEPTAERSVYSLIELQLARLLAKDGARLDASYVCRHAANSCNCRKPAPGMLLRASQDLSIDLERSFVIGDSETDVLAGRAVRAMTVLIDPARGSGAHAVADFVAGHVGEAVDWVLDVMVNRDRVRSKPSLSPRTRPSSSAASSSPPDLSELPLTEGVA